jgi:hypothetical protein
MQTQEAEKNSVTYLLTLMMKMIGVSLIISSLLIATGLFWASFFWLIYNVILLVI